MQRQKAYPRPRLRLRHKFLICVLFLLGLLAFSLVKLEQKIRPVAATVAAYECRANAVRLMQAAVNQSLLETPQLYENLYDVQYDSAGAIQSVAVNSLNMTSLQYQLETMLAHTLEQGGAGFGVPLGTLTGLQIFAGRGPAVAVKVIPLSHVESQVVSGFTSAGVNQTKLQIDLKFTAKLCAVLAGVQTQTSVETQICVAQLLIVGKTPQFFAQGADFAGQI